jgi:uncharacterized linocin/CFP29 family protein
MNNLHRELAPISTAAWTDIEDEARRTFTLHVAGRRSVDVLGPSGEQLSAVGTGHLAELEPPRAGVRARRRDIASVIELRVPFRVSRDAVDDVERGAKDSDWQPVKDAAKELAFAEDRAVVDGFTPAGITGVRPASSNPQLTLPADPREYPTAVAQAVSALRLAGVGGPYSRVIGDDSEIVWAPAIDGAVLLSTRGGDYQLHLGQDTSIGYLSHDTQSIELYLEESLTFLVTTAEAAVNLV